MQRSRGTPSGKLGGRTTVHSGGREFDVDPTDEPLVPEEPNPNELSSVGLSVSIGQSTEYAREKFEVAAWCTLPSAPDRASRQSAYDECYRMVTEELLRRKESVIDQFFPYLRK